MLFVDKTIPPAPVTPALPVPDGLRMPWAVGTAKGPNDRIYYHKIRNGIGGELLSPEEQQIAEFVAHLQAENERLQNENERFQAVLDGRANSGRPNPSDALVEDMLAFAQGLAARPVVTSVAPADSESADGFIVPPAPSNEQLAPDGTQLQDELEVAEIPYASSKTEMLEGTTLPEPPADPDAAEPAPGSKRAAAEAALLQTPDDSNVAIAKRIGCSHELVRLMRKDLEAAGRLQTVSPPE